MMGNAREIQRGASEVILGPRNVSQPPALPPRPTLDSGAHSNSTPSHPNLPEGGGSERNRNCSPCSRKYVLLCAACGGLTVVLGGLFAVLYFVLRSYTSSLHYFETVPSYVASVVLIVTGLLMLCFGWRRNRFGYLVKLCGACCLVCAIVCVVITVTTTVVHMNRLQTLRECIYNARGKSCTCFTGSTVQLMNQAAAAAAAAQIPTVHDVNIHQNTNAVPTASFQTPIHRMNFSHLNEEGIGRYVFADTPDCEVVHGALYACLRALFGLSVIGILVSLFSGMLVYQLLGHERKKMYWEQLELRSRALFRRHHPAPCCGCCQDCRFAPATSNSSSTGTSSGNLLPPWPPWDVLDDRYWNLHGGNLYSPGPCANGALNARAPGVASINACGGPAHVGSGGSCPAHRNGPVRSGAPASTSSWNWLPWRPSSSDNSGSGSGRTTRTQTEGGTSVIIGPDDHYGFPLSGNTSYRSPLAVSSPTANATSTASPVVPSTPVGSETMGMGGLAATVAWGPPPPYSSRGGSVSDTNSISNSTSLCLSPAGSPDPIVHSKTQKSSSTATSPNGSIIHEKDTNSLRKDGRLAFPRQAGLAHAVNRSVDPRRLPWSPNTAAINAPNHGLSIVTAFPNRSSVTNLQHADSPGGRDHAKHGSNSQAIRLDPDSELYFADTSSYTGQGSVHNDHDGSNESAMYEEIRGHRYDTIQRPFNSSSVALTGKQPPPVLQRTGKSSQRSSWDGPTSQIQRPNAGFAAAPRSRHSDTAASKEKLFSPIVVPKFINISSPPAPWLSNAGRAAVSVAKDASSFVPYRRAVGVPINEAESRALGSGEVYENVTNLDFAEKPRTLSPDEEVAILTSQFRNGPSDGDCDPSQGASDSDGDIDDGDSIIRAVNV